MPIKQITAFKTSDGSVHTELPNAEHWQARLDLISVCDGIMCHTTTAEALADALASRADTMRELLLPFTSEGTDRGDVPCA